MSQKLNHMVLFLFSLGILSGLSGCIQVDTPAALEITVLDQYNNPVSGASVAIFDDLNQWGMLENPVQVWKLTDDLGIVTYTGLSEQHYYIFAEKGELNNLKNEIKTITPTIENQVLKIRIHID